MLQLSVVHIKLYKNNCFFIISNIYGKVLWSTSLGAVGFANIQKRCLDAFIECVDRCFKQLLVLKKKMFFFKVEGLKTMYPMFFFKKLNLFLIKNKITFLGLSVIQKISHNGCRFKK